MQDSKANHFQKNPSSLYNSTSNSILLSKTPLFSRTKFDLPETPKSPVLSSVYTSEACKERLGEPIKLSFDVKAIIKDAPLPTATVCTKRLFSTSFLKRCRSKHEHSDTHINPVSCSTFKIPGHHNQSNVPIASGGSMLSASVPLERKEIVPSISSRMLPLNSDSDEEESSGYLRMRRISGNSIPRQAIRTPLGLLTEPHAKALPSLNVHSTPQLDPFGDASSKTGEKPVSTPYSSFRNANCSDENKNIGVDVIFRTPATNTGFFRTQPNDTEKSSGFYNEKKNLSVDASSRTTEMDSMTTTDTGRNGHFDKKKEDLLIEPTPRTGTMSTALAGCFETAAASGLKSGLSKSQAPYKKFHTYEQDKENKYKFPPENYVASKFTNQTELPDLESLKLSGVGPRVQDRAGHRVPTPSSSSSTESCRFTDDNKLIVVRGVSYHVLNLLGRGGSSKVYQVFCQRLNTLLAVKVVDLSEADKASKLSYCQEIDFLTKLKDCTRVIHMIDYEYMEHENILYIVMEKGELDMSQVLREMVSKSESLAQYNIQTYWSEMLKAVAEVHEKGIIHSDLKPANFIMVRGKLKLIDFGIASAMHSDLTCVVKDTQIGTVNYMSPEALFSSQPTSSTKDNVIKLRPKSDVWSLGCILYNLAYNHTPFQRIKNYVAKIQAITNPAFEIPFPPHQNKLLVDVIKKCLTRDPQKRPSIEELLEHPFLAPQSETNESMVQNLQGILSPNTFQKVSQALQAHPEQM